MKNLSKQIQKHFDDMCLSGKLFRSSIDGTTIWELYLSSFKPEDDPVFRDPASSVHNCNLCNNFIRRYGNIVAINENLEIITLFDIIPQKMKNIGLHLKFYQKKSRIVQLRKYSLRLLMN